MRIAVGVAQQILETLKEPGPGINLARQLRDKGLARPVAVPAPWGIQRQIVDQRGHAPSPLIGTGQRHPLAHGCIARVDQRIE